MEKQRPVKIRRDFVLYKVGALRHEFNLNTPPILIDDVIKNKGIIRKELLNLEKPCAFCYRGEYIIVTSPTGNEYRDRWSLVHEFGHIYLEHFILYTSDHFPLKKTPVLKYRSKHKELTNRERRILERECDIFTAELLMPVDILLKEVEKRDPFLLIPDDIPKKPTHKLINNLMKLFQVSREALLIRLEELKIIDSSRQRPS